MSTISYYIIRTGAQQERRTSAELANLGYHSFVPVEKKHLRRADGRHTRTREYPMFIRYAFIGCSDIYEAWTRLRCDPDIYPKLVQGAGPLGMGGRPYRLPASDVAHLLSLQGKQIPYRGTINPHRAYLSVKEGGRARVVDGPFAGHVGSVQRIVANRAHVSVEFLNSLHEVPMDLENLEAVG